MTFLDWIRLAIAGLLTAGGLVALLALYIAFTIRKGLGDDQD
jgi:hypothetical protein